MTILKIKSFTSRITTTIVLTANMALLDLYSTVMKAKRNYVNVYGLRVERDMYFKPRKLSEICHKPVKEYIDHYFKED